MARSTMAAGRSQQVLPPVPARPWARKSALQHGLPWANKGVPVSTATDDFIRSSGNLAYVNTWLKLIAFVLVLLSLTLGAALIVEVIDGRAEHVVPIVINQATGDAVAVDYRVVDAAGEERSPFEVRKFCEDFLTEAYTLTVSPSKPSWTRLPAGPRRRL